MDSDEETIYSYESEDADFYMQSLLALPDSEKDSAIDSMTESETFYVNVCFGTDRASFCEATAAAKVLHGPAFNGYVYFFFPIARGPLESKTHLARIWGFDPNIPIVIRFCHFIVMNNTPVSRKDFLVTVYQGDEPPVSSFNSVTKNITEVSFDKNVEDGEIASDSAHVKVIELISNIPFRIGDQIKNIVEEFLLKNVNGSDHGGTGFLKILMESQQKKCIQCTYRNQPEAITCEMCQGAKFVQVTEDGLLIQLYSHLNKKISRLHFSCINCDENHLPHTIQPALPSVCQRELCQWALTEYGIGRISTDDLALNAEVVDLLLAMTKAAAMSPRNKDILQPFPLVFLEKEKELDPENPDYNKMKELGDHLPSMQQIAASKNESHLIEICTEKGDLMELCKHKGKLVYGLLQWIITSCPASVVSLQGNCRLRSMGTPHQFWIQSASPEQEETFSKAKANHGSTFAFHGSAIENWHCILREGLKNVSGTPLQLHGAAHGKGVYFSPQAAVSSGYSKIQPLSSFVNHDENPNANIFISDKEVRIMALCEIIDTDIRRHGNIWVVPNDKHVIVRFLFVFVPTSSGFAEDFKEANRCNTTNASFRDEIIAIHGQIIDAGTY